jgi:transcriptional regulator GlxA family with amidase domain
MTWTANNTVTFIIFVTPHFNLATTTAFLDPFRAANYLIGESRFKWSFVSATGGDIPSSNGMSIATRSIKDAKVDEPDIVVVSSSWSPERYQDEALIKALQR